MNELLKVLDMSEDEQIRWVSVKFPVEHIYAPSVASAMKITHPEQIMTRWDTPTNRRILADLAFRLRDEAINYPDWGKALIEVHNYWQDQNRTGITLEGFWIHRAQPIHWIIATLIAIAKEKEDE